MLVAGALLAAPPVALERLGLTKFRITYLPWIGLTFLVCGAVLISEGTVGIFTWIKNRRAVKAVQNEILNYLRSLTPPEKFLLAKYFSPRTDTQYFSAANGLVSGLEAKSLIYRSSHVGNLLRGTPTFAYNIQPWIRDYIDEHPEILAGAQPPEPTPLEAFWRGFR